MKRVSSHPLHLRLARRCSTGPTATATANIGSSDTPHAAASTPSSWARRLWRNSLAQTVVGFGLGVGLWCAVERWNIIPPETREAWGRALIAAMHRQRHDADRSWLPQGVRDALDSRSLLVVPNVLASSTEQSAADALTPPRTPFKDILLACQLEEQLDWMGEHVSDEIPFFYIEELVHTWASIYYAAYCFGIRAPPPPPEVEDHVSLPLSVPVQAMSPSRSYSIDAKIIQRRSQMPSDTPDGVDELIRGLWHLTACGTLSPQAGFGALAVLTGASHQYALSLAAHVAKDTGAVGTPTEQTAPPKFARILSEGEALRCFDAFLDQCRRVNQRRCTVPSAASSADVNGSGTVMPVERCGPPLDLCNGNLETHAPPPPQDSLVRLAAPYAKVAANGFDAARLSSLCLDPLVVLIANVDAALSREARDKQKRRYGFLLGSPTTWLHPITQRWPPAASTNPSPANLSLVTTTTMLPFMLVKDTSLVPFSSADARQWLAAYCAEASQPLQPSGSSHEPASPWDLHAVERHLRTTAPVVAKWRF